MATLDFGYLKLREAEWEIFLAHLLLKQPDPIAYEKAEIVTKWPLVAYLLTAMFCLGCSTACHLTYVKSAKVSKAVSCLDYWGIAALFLGSAYPYVGYNFACGPMIFWRYVFSTLLTICAGAVMVLTTLP